MVTRLIVETEVKAVERRSTPSQPEMIDGKWQPGPQIDMGWFILIGNLAIGVGNDKPEIVPGKIKLIIEQ